MSLAENIRFLRKKLGLSQDELAEKLGYKSYTTVQKWESGVADPPLKSLGKMQTPEIIVLKELLRHQLSTTIWLRMKPRH